MSNPLTPNDVAKMMVSVSEMGFRLYPKSYKTDAQIVKILNLKNSRLMYRNEFFVLLEMYYGNVTNWFNLFRKRFGDSVSIEEHYDELVENFSSPEIIAYYNIYPNLSYFFFELMDEEDDRDSRVKNKTVMNLPDAEIKSMYVNLRNLFPQETVDKFNKFFIANNMMTDNAMFKKPAVLSLDIPALLDLFGNFVGQYKDEKFADEIYSAISFIDIDELSKVRMTLLTDYPHL